MPITLNIVDHPARNWSSRKVNTAEELLQNVSPKQYQRTKMVLQSSFGRRHLREVYTSPSPNGFVWAAIAAYNNHHHLCIRPEDVWFAILVQIGLYINANAESLRSFFVEHEGQKPLVVFDNGSLETADFGAMALSMTHEIGKNIKDPELRSWVMPSFSTTSDTDLATASVLFMGAMQKYFSYKMQMLCGIPSVTILGESSDWEDILVRIDKLERLGEEPKQFADMLRPILRNILLSFTEPSHPDVIRFWNSVADKHQMSGSCKYSGWIGAFCFWDEKGRVQLGSWRNNEQYPVIDSDRIPAGFCSVPVIVDDNGDELKCTMIAGSVGIQARPTDLPAPDGETTTSELRDVDAESVGSDGQLSAIQPLSGWWICENESSETAQARQSEINSIREELDELRASRRNRVSEDPSPSMDRTMELLRRQEELMC